MKRNIFKTILLSACILQGLLALPVSERERFAAEKHDVNGVEKSVADMTAKELKKAIEERDAARQTMEAMKARAEVAEPLLFLLHSCFLPAALLLQLR